MTYNFTALTAKLTDTGEWLTREFASIRTGRAAPNLLDAVQVTAYGSRMPLNQTANVSVEDARTLRVTPFDAALIKEVEKGITDADLGVGITAGETSVRVSFPELTGERRQELVKVAKHKLEEARTAVRAARDDVWSDIQKQERDGAISEDDKFRLKEEMQKLVDDANKNLEHAFEQKEQEVLQ